MGCPYTQIGIQVVSRHIIETLETPHDSETIQAANAGHVEAIKAYLSKKYDIKATEVTPTLLRLTE